MTVYFFYETIKSLYNSIGSLSIDPGVLCWSDHGGHHKSTFGP